jgi:galactoside O-acetyltransferase
MWRFTAHHNREIRLAMKRIDLKQQNSAAFEVWMQSNAEAKVFTAMREGRRISIVLMLSLALKAIFFEPFLWGITHYPGAVGMKMREFFYKGLLNKMGHCVLLGEGVRIDGPQRISIGDFVWIDKNVHLFSGWGSIQIGRRVHVAEDTLISGSGNVIIEDYVGISKGVSIYSHSESIVGGKRMSGPMIPENQKGMKTAPVRICKDAFIGTNAVILPGIIIGEGAVIAANSLVTNNVNEWEVVMGVPAQPVGRRPKVNVEDI